MKNYKFNKLDDYLNSCYFCKNHGILTFFTLMALPKVQHVIRRRSRPHKISVFIDIHVYFLCYRRSNWDEKTHLHITYNTSDSIPLVSDRRCHLLLKTMFSVLSKLLYYWFCFQKKKWLEENTKVISCLNENK